ncbi:hypothetical protein [Flavobacterium suncheonense]|uniref:hypothetical protein n=1 Tax=Flavobacterium suncheonense TaxID=350894 RepID=UPI003FA3BBF9
MKKLSLLSIALCFSCHTQKIAMAKTSEPLKSNIESVCPEDGACTLELQKNKSIAVKTDITGKLYCDLEDHSGTSVIHYVYTRNTDPELQDGQHREEIIFEIDNTVSELDLNNWNLSQTKMIFGRHCFCRGQAGYFVVKQGKLRLQHTKEALRFVLDFTVTEVPQTLTQVKGTFTQ